jgi:myo-inositol 2-dehydrogenase / D-chiro-inositol 1-dehydrogenase
VLHIFCSVMAHAENNDLFDSCPAVPVEWEPSRNQVVIMTSNPNRNGFNRRTFLMGALASVTAPAFFSSRAWGGPNDTILTGVVGTGRMGRGDLQELILRGLDANVRLVAVCDVDSARLEAGKKLVEETYAKYADTAGPYAGCKAYADYRELLKQDDIDGVLIVTPDHWHAPIAIAAAKAGKDIYLQKPLTYSIAEGQALVRAVRDNKRVFQTGSQHRSNIYVRKACEIVRNGHIGKIHTIKVGLPEDKGSGEPGSSEVPKNLNFEMWMGPTEEQPYIEGRVHPQKGFGRPGWLQTERYCRGMITGWGAHMNDIAQWGNGTDDSGVTEIEAKAEFPKRGVFDVHTTFKAEGKFANGVKLIQETMEAGVRFEGDKGWIFVFPGRMEASDPELLKIKIGPEGTKLYESKNHMMNWLECMRSRKEPVATVEMGHRSNSICVLTHIAMKLGRKLEWDPKTEKFVKDDEADKMLDYPHRDPWKV